MQTRGEGLAQGDFLLGCGIPVVKDDFGDAMRNGSKEVVPTVNATVEVFDVIVITQSCDLERGNDILVALCPIFSISSYEIINTSFQKTGKWDLVRQGRVEGLHLLASPTNPEDNRSSLVVNFREIYSLPIAYVKRHAGEMGDRWRLQSPYLEHFSQAFARFFMRVGLPSGIAPFK